MAKKSLSRWLLYSICLAPALLMLGYYALEYIPGQREYFVSLRFRSLTNIAGQVRIKLGSLLTALAYATESGRDAAQYIEALVPDLAYPRGDCEDSGKPSARFTPDGQGIRFKAAKGCAAETPLAKIFSSFVADELFDDVLIAESGGRVLYQRSQTSPRIASLGDLRKSAPESKAGPAEGSPADADSVRYVRLDESDFALMMQPVRIPALDTPDKTLVACGLVRSQRLAREARHVPPLYLLAIFAPLLIVFLSGPFLKILLLTRTGRLAFRDLAALSLCAVVTAGLLTLLFASWRHYWTGDSSSEPDLKNFANSVNDQLVGDLRRMHASLEQIDAQLPAYDARSDPDRINLLDSGLSAGWNAESAPFDFAFWTNAAGCQVAKWTTKRFNTQRVDQRAQQHFQELRAGNFWSIDAGRRKFTLETLVSPTTSQLIVVLGLPPENPGRSAPCRPGAEPSPIVEAAMVGLLPSVTSPATPPGAGFAIFDRRGNVIFHSSPDRNLHENLFDEIRSPEPWRAAVATRAERDGCAFYRGRKFRLHMQPLRHIDGSGWSIAAFRELEPRQAAIGIVWAETLVLFLAPLVLGTVALLLLSMVLRAVRRQTWREQLDVLLACIWPDPARAAVFRRLAWELAAAAAVSLAVVSVGSLYVYRSSPWLMPFCFAAPLAAVALAVFRLRKPDPAGWDLPPEGRRQPAYIACISLLLVMLAVVPVFGLFSIADAFESRLSLMRWQRDLVDSLRARRARVEALINASPAFTDASRKRALELFRQREDPPDRGGKVYIRQFWHSAIASEAALLGASGVQPGPWHFLLAALRPETQSDTMETGTLARSPGQSGGCRWFSGAAASLILSCPAVSSPVVLTSELPPITVALDPLFWLGVLLLAGGGYAWNCRALYRIFLQDFDYTPLPLLTALPAPAEVHSDILLVGLPLARKDEAVRNWLGYTPPRVNLYASRFSKTWLDKTIARLRGELAASAQPALQAAAAGGGSSASPRPVPRRPWIHISNLESKLANPAEREAVADLVEGLVTLETPAGRPRLIVTSTVDPIFHFDSALGERKKIYDHPLTEPELQRFSRLLHNFCKVQLPGPAAPAWVSQTAAGAAIYEECRHHQALLGIGEEVASVAPPGARREALLARVAERAQALYKLFWACCTRSEKLLLVQLAQTGLVNPLSVDTLQVLVRKGLVLPGPRPRLMNETLLRFVAGVESPSTVGEWESEAGDSSWPVIRNIVLVLIIAGLGVVAMTQHEAMQTVTAVLSGVGAAMTGLFRLAGYFGNRREAAGESA